MISTSKKLDQESVFDSNLGRDSLTIFISVTDDDLSEAVENYSARLLNSAKVFERFSKRYES